MNENIMNEGETVKRTKRKYTRRNKVSGGVITKARSSNDKALYAFNTNRSELKAWKSDYKKHCSKTGRKVGGKDYSFAAYLSERINGRLDGSPTGGTTTSTTNTTSKINKDVLITVVSAFEGLQPHQTETTLKLLNTMYASSN